MGYNQPMLGALERWGSPTRLRRAYLYGKYATWCVVVYWALSHLLPEYVAVVVTTWFMISLVLECDPEEREILDPPDIVLIISDKIRSIGSGRAQSDR